MDLIDSFAFSLPGYVTYDSDFDVLKRKYAAEKLARDNKKLLAQNNNNSSLINVKAANKDSSNVEDVEEPMLYFNKQNNLKPKLELKNETAKKNALSVSMSKSKAYNEDSSENEESNSNIKISTKTGQSLSLSVDRPLLNLSKDNKSASEEITAYLNLLNVDLNEFIYKPAPKGVTIECVFNRDKQGIDGGIHPAFYMYLENKEKKKTFLLASRRKGLGLNVNYAISVDPVEIEKYGTNYVGKLKPSMNANNFTLFDNGADVKEDLDVAIRRELCYMSYESTVKYRGPRKITALIPAIKENGDAYLVKPTTEKQTLAECFKSKKLKNLCLLENKPPVWNNETGSFALNFHGRVSKSSVKNFQIIQRENPSQIIMQFGKTGKNSFICDYSYPMSAIQAFGVALSCFDL